MNKTTKSKSTDVERTERYNRERTTTINLRLFPADADIVRHLAEIDEPKATYIKRLIRKDMPQK